MQTLGQQKRCPDVVVWRDSQRSGVESRNVRVGQANRYWSADRYPDLAVRMIECESSGCAVVEGLDSSAV